MQILYAVEVDAETTAPDGDAFSCHLAILEAVADWISYPAASQQVGASDLMIPGQFSLPSSRHPDQLRSAEWLVESAAGCQGTRLSVEEPVFVGDGLFRTEVTVVTIDETTTLRIILGRQAAENRLAPIPVQELHQPHVLRSLTFDPRLRLFIRGQQVDSRYEQAFGRDFGTAMVDVLSSATRLPVFFINRQDSMSYDIARNSARNLIGLTSVVLGDESAASVIREELGALYSIPRGGARLFWPNLELRHPEFTRDDLSALGLAGTRQRLMTLLSGVSVAARGRDTRWSELLRRTRSTQAEALDQVAREAIHDFQSRLAQLDPDAIPAEDANSMAAVLAAAQGAIVGLQERLATETSDRAFWEFEAQQYADEVAELTRSTARLANERDTWKAAALGTSVETSPTHDPWTQIPILVWNDAGPTLEALVEASEGRIQFSDNAERSWNRIAYDDCSGMTEALVALARAAHMLYSTSTTERTMPRLDEWFYTEFGIKVAMSDDTIEESKRLRYFHYEGEKYSQAPHVKVKDGVPPPECGRIHFALDSSRRYVVVNHIGTKLY